MLDAGSRCAAALGKRVIFLSGITRWLAHIGLCWERIGADFPAAQNELARQSPGLFVMVSSRAYTILCSTARNLTIHYTDGTKTEVTAEERELVKASFKARLDADWPSYLTRALANAQPAASTTLAVARAAASQAGSLQEPSTRSAKPTRPPRCAQSGISAR
jgi:hypothetical protein